MEKNSVDIFSSKKTAERVEVHTKSVKNDF